MATVAPLNPQRILAPVLPALPPAAVSTEPATGLLPLLSPILRQRVQLLADPSSEPWLRLLCYDVAKVAKLGEVVRGGNLEPHPVSGEVEVDWEYDVETRYRRLDDETLQALVVMATLGLAFQLVWCINDEAGGGDGWRVGEVTVPDESAPFGKFGGFQTLGEAESRSKQAQTSRKPTPKTNGERLTPLTPLTPAGAQPSTSIEEEDDDGYWESYDATPGRTPAHSTEPSPAPRLTRNNAAPDEEYFSRYDEVQPAMDNHDPDEEMPATPGAAPPLGLGPGNHLDSASHTPRTPQPLGLANPNLDEVRRATSSIHHPRPESSASSQGSVMVAKLEATAGKQEQNEFGVKQHVSRSIRSLFMLSQASGIDREEFEQLVRTELDLLGMMEEGS